MHYVYFKDSKGEWRWRFEANGRTIACSSGAYKQQGDIMPDIDLLQKSADAEVKEISLDSPASVWPKRLSFGLLIIGAIFLSALAFALGQQRLTGEVISNFITRRFSHLTAREMAVLLAPVVAGGIALLTHIADGLMKGGGIRHRVRETHPMHVQPDSAAISATLTKQSVLAAIAAILLVIVQTVKGAIPNGSPDVAVGFPALAAELSTIGFVTAILLLLISMKCYDYAHRFNLAKKYKDTLLHKGLKLDINSWYLLLYSFAMGVAVISETLSILLTMFGGLMLWWYYFIHERQR